MNVLLLRRIVHKSSNLLTNKSLSSSSFSSYQNQNQIARANRSLSSISASTPASSSTSTTAKKVIPEPTKEQLRNHFIANGLPMIGFGVMDQTVMIQAGNAIDCTIGVSLGLSTLTAAAVGGLLSNLSGVLFGGTLETLAKAWGLPASNLSAAQRSLPRVKKGRLASQALGILFGCTLGLLNILLIDTDKSSSLKLQSINEEQEFAFEIEASNSIRDDATVVVVRGPDVDGILASFTAALSLRGYSLLEVNARQTIAGEEGGVAGSDISAMIEDTFVIVNSSTKKQLEDDQLEELGTVLLEASREGPNVLKYQVKELETKNAALQNRIHHLESVLLKRRMTVKPSGKGMVRVLRPSSSQQEQQQE
jgi:hypothetical protein